MNWVLLISIAIHLTALVCSVELLRRLRDWRLAFLSLMLALMILRRGLALFPPGATSMSQQWAEVPALVISVMSLLAVIFLGTLLDELKRSRESGERAIEELGERERRLRAIIEAEPECVKLLGPGCMLLQMNPAGLRMIGADSLGQVVGRSMLDLVLPEYQRAFAELTERVLRGATETLEYEIQGLRGTRRRLETHATPYRDASGQITSLLGITRDITDLKQAEQARREALQFLESLVHSVDGIVWEADAQTIQFSFVSQQAERILGYPLDHWLTEPTFWRDHLHPQDRDAAVDFCLNATGKGDSHQLEYRMLSADGRAVWLRDIVTVVLKDEVPVKLLGIMVDITEQKRVEEVLRESQVRLQLIVNASNIGLWDWDLITNEVNFSSIWKQQLGYANEELQGRYEEWESRLHPDDREQALTAVNEFRTDRRTDYEVEFRLRHKNGSWRWILARAVMTRDVEGRPLRMMGCHLDITERKRAEETLLASQQRFAKMFHSSPVGVCVSTLETGIFLDVNDAFLTVVGHAREDVLGRSSLDLKLNYWIDPEDRRKLVQALKEHGSVRNWDVSFRRKDGSIGHSLRSLERITLAGEDCILTILNDITDRRQMEEALRQSERFSRAILDALTANIAILDESGVILRVNRAWHEFADGNSDNIASLCEGANYLLACDQTSGAGQETAVPFAAGIRAVIAGTQDEFTLEYPCHSPTEQRWFVGYVTRFRGDGPKRIVVSHTNVTERWLAEEARRESEARFRRIIESDMIGMLFWSTSGGINDANDAFLRLVGYTPEDVRAGRVHWREMTPPEYQTLDENALREMAATGTCTPFEKEYFRKDGSRVPILIGATTFAEQPGEGVAFVLDITERKRADDELRASRERLQVLSRQLLNAQEAERQHIARELHDQIGQSMTAIKLNLKSIQPSPYEATAWTILQETIAVVDQTLEQVRTLSLNLRPSMLDDLGLAAALRWYLDRQAQRAGFSVHFASELSASDISQEIETTCYRVAQELVTNVVRHAHARNVRVELRRLDTEMELFIQDDGVGFDLNAAREQATLETRLGLLGVQERVLIVGGRLEIQTAPSRGTEIRVRFQLMPASAGSEMEIPHTGESGAF